MPRHPMLMALAVVETYMQQELLDRRTKLQHGLSRHDASSQRLQCLLDEVDSALARLHEGRFGICEVCNLEIEPSRLLADPLVSVCLDHWNDEQKRALEHDLELAARVQKGLLPPCRFDGGGWSISYHYEAAGMVSGDYCDIVDAGDQGLYFMVGDVSGKGLAASMLMAHLHAMFRTLIGMDISLQCMLQHAARVFSESTLPNQFATLVCGRALPCGAIEIANAGHPRPLLLHRGQVREHEHNGLPLGLFHDEEFQVRELEFEPGESMLIYSDGVSDAVDHSGQEYGIERLREVIANANGSGLLECCRDDVYRFRGHAPRVDDITLFVLKRVA